ncbi:hypothetical protein ElyMa_001062400 [Elysia marginata]|uniref:C2H2-type domain-containing protein n=1 Tax=Elysia marginata TaxID=1093978 RepID=A0AAV4HQN7_9GAST|nr:hypothetical protein ElyMa_001062400 [Elysia marginata]
MGQQISAAAESVGSGAASSGAGLSYSATAMASDTGGVASMSVCPTLAGDTSRGETNHHSLSQQQQQQQVVAQQNKAMFDSLRAFPPVPKPPSMSNAPSTILGNSADSSGGGGGSRGSVGGGDQGDSQPGGEMELGKMSIREAIDSFIERCLHNSNDGGASDNEYSEESLSSHQSKASASNIFALENSSKRSPSSSCHSPATPSRDKDCGPSSKREKARMSGRESRTSRDSGSSSSSPKPLLDRGESCRPLSRQQERGDKMLSERRDSIGDSNRDGKSSDSKPSVSTELVMKVDPSLDEGEDTVLVIDCDSHERDDDKDSKGKRSPVGDEDEKSSHIKRETVEPKTEVKEEPKPEFQDGVRVKHESGEVGPTSSPRQKSLAEKEDDQSGEVNNSPGHHLRSNLLMWEMSKKPGAQSSSPSNDVKPVRPSPFLPGPKHFQFILDKVLDSTLNDTSDSPSGDKSKEEACADSEKKASSPKETDSKVEIIKVEEPVRMESLDLKSSSKDKADKNLLKEQMAQTKVPVCFKDHIEKVLLESFLSYEEEERKAALKKAENSTTGLGADGINRESGNADAPLSKTVSSPKNAISVQDIVDRVITQTEAINKNMSTPCASENRMDAQVGARYSVIGAQDSGQHPTTTLASRSHTSTSSTSSTAEGSYSNHHQHYPHNHPQQQQQHSASQPMSSQEKALQEAQRHVVLKEHQSSTNTGRKRGRPRRVSPSTSGNTHPHHGSTLADYRLNAGHHYSDDRSRTSHHHGPAPPPLDYNPHGSLSFGLPQGVPNLLPPPGSASLIRQQQMEQQRQQQQAKDLHSHALHGSPSGSGAYLPPGSRGHQREPIPHPMDIHHSRSHLPHHQQHPTGSISGGSGGGSSSSGGSGIKPPPPLILADSISPGTRLVPVSHIPTKSCSCHSCVAHFSGSSSTSSSVTQNENNGCPASQHARLVQQQQQHQHQQSLRPGSSSNRLEGRENSRSPHHPSGHAPHSHPAYGAAGSYPVASPPSSSASSRHALPPSAKDFYNQGHLSSRGGECLRPVASMPSRGLPPQAIIPTFVAAQRHQQQRDGPPGHGPDVLATSAPSPNQPQHYPRDNSHPRYYDSKSSPVSTASSSSTPSATSYHHYSHGSQHHGPYPSHHHNPHHQHHQTQQQQQPRHSSPSSQHHRHMEHRYPPEHESPRYHPDYIPPSASNSSSAAHYRYDQRSQREHGSGQPVSLHPGPSSTSSSSLRAPPNLLPPGNVSRPSPAPVESDSDAPLDLSVKPSRKQEHGGAGGRPPTEGAASHRTSAGPHGQPPSAEADLQYGTAYRRRSLDMSDARPGQYKHPGDYRESIPPSHQPHSLQTLENSVDRILAHPHHHRSSYQGHHQHQHQQHPHPALPPPHHHHSQPPHLRVSVSPHGPRANPDPQYPRQPHPMDHHQERSVSYSTSARSQQSPGQQKGYPPHLYPPSSGHTSNANPPSGMYPHYPLSSTSPSMPQHPHSHPPHAARQQPPPPPPPQHYASQSQHHSKISSNSSGSANSNNSGHSTAPSPSAQSYYSRSPVLGRPQAVSPASAGPHHYQKALESSPHQPYPHGAFPPPPPQSNSPYQRPPSHNQDGDNARPSPVNSSRPSSGPPPPLTRRPSDTPSPDEEELDAQGKLNISKHEPIQNIIGNHSPGDILYLICRLCRQTYGNPYGFRKHFRKEHGFEPKAEHTVVQTISATKSAMAHPSSIDQVDGSQRFNSEGPDKRIGNQLPSHHREDPHSNQPYPRSKPEEPASKEGPRYYGGDTRSSEGLPPPKRAEVLKNQKLLECAECSQTFQLNDFGAYKRHCRQHSGGSGSGPFLCHDCHRCFAEPEQLQEHLNTHADFTLSVCGICLTPFSTPDYLAEHLKAAHGHTAGNGPSGSSSSSASTTGWDKGENCGASSGHPGSDRKTGCVPEGVQPGKPCGPSSQHPHPSIVMGTSAASSIAPSSSSWCSSTSTTAQSSRRPVAEHGEPQHAVVHTPRDLQIEKLPADPTVMTASPDSSYTDEKLCADSQSGVIGVASKSSINSSQSQADSGPSSLRQQERDSDSNSSSPSSRSRDAFPMRRMGSPLTRQSRDSSSSQSHTPTPQVLTSGKQSTHPSESSKSAAKEDNDSVSSDRCASVDSNSLSIEGSRTSSPAVDEPDFSYKHKKYSRYNRKRSTEAYSISGEPGIKSARSSSAESNPAASTPVTSTTVTTTASATAFSSSNLSHTGGKNEYNLSPVVTSSASNTGDCESSTSSSHASLDDSVRSRSPSTKGSNSSSSKRGENEPSHKDSQSKKSSASEENHSSKEKGAKSSDSSKKRKAEDASSVCDENSAGKRWSGNVTGGSDSTGGDSGKFKWERMTRSQMGKASQAVSYSSSN